MSWQKLKEEALKYQTVYVTGCQRTGTTFCAKALAEEIGYKHIDESEFDADNVSKFHQIDKTNAVVQCPALFHLFPSIAEGGLIVWINRPVVDVGRSMEYSGWFDQYGLYELNKYPYYNGQLIPTKLNHLLKMRDVSNMTMIDYNDLKAAKDYLPKEQRKDFTIKQTEV